MQYSIVKNFLFPLLLGAFFSLGFPSNLNLEPNLFFSLVAWILMSLLMRNTLGKSKLLFFQSFFFTIGIYLNLFVWMNVGIISFNQSEPSLNIILHLIFFLAQALTFLYTPFLLLIVKKYKPILKIVIFALVQTALEIIPTRFFPYDLGHIFINHQSLLAWLPISGVYFYSFFLYAVFAIILFSYTKKQILYNTTSLILVLFIPGLVPLSKQKKNKATHRAKPFIIRMSQTGPQTFKPHQDYEKNSQFIMKFYQSTLDLFSLNLNKVDLHILPESFFPFDQFIPNKIDGIYGKELGTFLTSAQITLFGGINREIVENIEYRSGVVQAFLKNQSPRIIYKKKLVPFSENFPFPSWLKERNKKKSPEMMFLSSIYRKSNSHIETEDVNFVVSFCWEILFSAFQQSEISKSKRVDFIVNIANESFFKGTNEQDLHLFMAKTRSLEHNIPIFKVTRTGFSAYIKNGKVEKIIKKGEVGFIDIPFIKESKNKTIYYKFGVIATLLGILFQIIFVSLPTVLRLTIKRISKNDF